MDCWDSGQMKGARGGWAGCHKVRRRSHFGEVMGRWGIIQVTGCSEQVKIVGKIPQESTSVKCSNLDFFFCCFSSSSNWRRAHSEGRWRGDISWSPTELLRARTVGAAPASPPVTNHPGTRPDNPDQQAISFPSLCLRRPWKPSETWPWEFDLACLGCALRHLAHLGLRSARTWATSGGRSSWHTAWLPPSTASWVAGRGGGQRCQADVLALRGSGDGSSEFV